ncbi:hypothetical protein VDG1235_1135 [Verrucomicrobiia bacterium DG1235]|nr:hypothetical protein VDG1235_1135 [Verrucomicrobiae bacterium DG1235]
MRTATDTPELALDLHGCLGLATGRWDGLISLISWRIKRVAIEEGLGDEVVCRDLKAFADRFFGAKNLEAYDEIAVASSDSCIISLDTLEGVKIRFPEADVACARLGDSDDGEVVSRRITEALDAGLRGVFSELRPEEISAWVDVEKLEWYAKTWLPLLPLGESSDAKTLRAGGGHLVLWVEGEKRDYLRELVFSELASLGWESFRLTSDELGAKSVGDIEEILKGYGTCVGLFAGHERTVLPLTQAARNSGCELRLLGDVRPSPFGFIDLGLEYPFEEFPSGNSLRLFAKLAIKMLVRSEDEPKKEEAFGTVSIGDVADEFIARLLSLASGKEGVVWGALGDLSDHEAGLVGEKAEDPKEVENVALWLRSPRSRAAAIRFLDTNRELIVKYDYLLRRELLVHYLCFSGNREAEAFFTRLAQSSQVELWLTLAESVVSSISVRAEKVMQGRMGRLVLAVLEAVATADGKEGVKLFVILKVLLSKESETDAGEPLPLETLRSMIRFLEEESDGVREGEEASAGADEAVAYLMELRGESSAADRLYRQAFTDGKLPAPLMCRWVELLLASDKVDEASNVSKHLLLRDRGRTRIGFDAGAALSKKGRYWEALPFFEASAENLVFLRESYLPDVLRAMGATRQIDQARAFISRVVSETNIKSVDTSALVSIFYRDFIHEIPQLSADAGLRADWERCMQLHIETGEKLEKTEAWHSALVRVATALGETKIAEAAANGSRCFKGVQDPFASVALVSAIKSDREGLERALGFAKSEVEDRPVEAMLWGVAAALSGDGAKACDYFAMVLRTDGQFFDMENLAPGLAFWIGLVKRGVGLDINDGVEAKLKGAQGFSGYFELWNSWRPGIADGGGELREFLESSLR